MKTVAARSWFVMGAVAALLPSACKPDRRSGVDAGIRPAGLASDLKADAARSRISLRVVKDRDFNVPVPATITLREGVLAAAGTARVVLDLETFDSGIPLRNERVRGVFFETSGRTGDAAELDIVRIPDDAMAALREGKAVQRAKVDGNLQLHGATIRVALSMDAGWNPDGGLWIKSAEPIEVKISALGLLDNLAKLTKICQHESIDDVVKVEVSLLFPPR